jgi:hypothetical protein
MDKFGRTPNILKRVKDDLYHLAPIPVLYQLIDVPDLDELNQALIEEARSGYPEPVLEVPDRRHIGDMGSKRIFDDLTWSEKQEPAIGIWHNVPTNNFLSRPAGCIARLRAIIVERYLWAVETTEAVGSLAGKEPWISESWIQFYKNGDDKVLHNHERYGPPYPAERWSGAYYMHNGDPDESMPYAGMFSFRVRHANYFIRPLPGLLMMWPSDILHEVHPFYGASERVVVNFNINLGDSSERAAT